MSVTFGPKPVRLDTTQREEARQLLGALRWPTPSDRAALITPDSPSAAIELPTEVYRLLIDILGHLADGDAVTVAPIRSEVTTQQAADLLNVSRPHLIKLLDQGAFPFHRVGNRRKMALSDVLHLRDRLIETRREKVDHHLGDSETLGVVEDDELELRQ